MPYGSNDLPFMLADFGEVVVFGVYTSKAILDHQTDVQDLGDQMAVLGSTISILFQVSALPGLKKASAITVGGTSYKVREIHKQDDGQLARAFLEMP